MSWRTNRRTKKPFKLSRKAPRATANFYRERILNPVKGAETATIVSGEHRIIRQRVGGEWRTQSVLHPRSVAEFQKLCARGKCPVGRE